MLVQLRSFNPQLSHQSAKRHHQHFSRKGLLSKIEESIPFLVFQTSTFLLNTTFGFGPAARNRVPPNPPNFLIIFPSKDAILGYAGKAHFSGPPKIMLLGIYIYIYNIYRQTPQFARAYVDDVPEDQKTLCFVGQNAHVRDLGFHLATHRLGYLCVEC